jgi:hypothetical protein
VAVQGHAEGSFWRWVCSWARAVRKPSDLGFPDAGFELPPLECHEHEVKPKNGPGRALFDVPAQTLSEQREEQKRTVPERCERWQSSSSRHRRARHLLVSPERGGRPPREAPRPVRRGPGRGIGPRRKKEEAFAAFAAGQVRVLVTKPKIGGFGLNWQHCAHRPTSPATASSSGTRACAARGGSARRVPVRVDVVTTPDGEAVVLGNLQRKAAQAEVLFSRLVQYMRDSLEIQQSNPYTRAPEIPQWL